MDNKNISVVYQNFTINIGSSPEDMVELVVEDLYNKNKYLSDFMYVRID
jgi:hypothetical protein